MATGNTVKVLDFASPKKAISEFKKMADELGYDNITEESNSIGNKMEAGGIGHDFRLELYINNL